MPNTRFYNQISIEVFESGSTTRISDAAGDLLRAEGLTFETYFPHGLYGTCEFFIPRDPTANWPFTGGQRLVVRNGLTIVWEGGISDIGYDNVRGGRWIRGTGYWARILGVRGIEKPWADNRLDEAHWVYQPATADDGSEKGSLDRLNRLRFTPKAVEWDNTGVAVVRYTMPTGQTVKRVVYTDELDENGQAWRTTLFNVGTSSTLVARTSDGSGANDHTLVTPSQSIDFRFSSQATQTPAADGSVFGQFSGVMVYSETGSINAQEIAKDVRAAVLGLNSDESKIGALTLSLEPFVTQGYEMFASILARAAGFGDASFNSWNIKLDHSETAQTPDGKPVMVLEQYADLDDFDYLVSMAEAPMEIVEDTEGLRNYIVVRYRDELNNRDVIVTPADDGTLKDDDAITAAGGQREYVLDAGLTTEAAAINLGRRVLAAKKDPRYYMARPISLSGSIRAKNGQRVPVSQVRAGQRVRIEDFVADRVGVSGGGLTFHISRTRYDDDSETVEISCDVPDDLAVMLAQLAAFGDRTVL